MTTLAVIAGLAILAGLAFYLLGRKSEKALDLQKAAKVSKEQAEIAVNAPKGKDEILDRLRKSGL